MPERTFHFRRLLNKRDIKPGIEGLGLGQIESGHGSCRCLRSLPVVRCHRIRDLGIELAPVPLRPRCTTAEDRQKGE